MVKFLAHTEWFSFVLFSFCGAGRSPVPGMYQGSKALYLQTPIWSTVLALFIQGKDSTKRHVPHSKRNTGLGFLVCLFVLALFCFTLPLKFMQTLLSPGCPKSSVSLAWDLLWPPDQAPGFVNLKLRISPGSKKPSKTCVLQSKSHRADAVSQVPSWSTSTVCALPLCHPEICCLWSRHAGSCLWTLNLLHLAELLEAEAQMCSSAPFSPLRQHHCESTWTPYVKDFLLANECHFPFIFEVLIDT